MHRELVWNLNSLCKHKTGLQEVTSLPDQLDEAANYIKKLQTKLEKMREKKSSLMGIENPNASTNSGMMMGYKPPQIEIHEIGSALEVVLITGLDCQFMFNETIRVLHEEGAEIVNASFTVVEDTVFHTIHSKVGDSALGYGATGISARLKKFVSDANAI
uniref:BHLH domain-containing protein n=1 Tax=Fagus sylvatica TaxID=28930 RepID=A0A2N9EBG8_FAGSY